MTPPKNWSGLSVTVGPQESDPRYVVAIISKGHPNEGDGTITVLTVEKFLKGVSQETIRQWAERMFKEKPWEPRQ